MSEKVPPVTPPASVPEGRGPISPRAQWGCPRCGSTDLASTYLVDYSESFGNIYLAPKGLTLRKLNGWFSRPFRTLTKVYADTCRNCGMVILEVNTEDLAVAEKRFGRR
jgi:uncharacterized protein (DUF983 family)